MVFDYNGKIRELLDCPFEVKVRSPCERLYKLVSMEEKDDAIVMIFELIEEENNDD